MEPYDVIVNQPVVIGKKAEEPGALQIHFRSQHTVSVSRMENNFFLVKSPTCSVS
jgi:hypothetical protein